MECGTWTTTVAAYTYIKYINKHTGVTRLQWNFKTALHIARASKMFCMQAWFNRFLKESQQLNGNGKWRQVYKKSADGNLYSDPIAILSPQIVRYLLTSMIKKIRYRSIKALLHANASSTDRATRLSFLTLKLQTGFGLLMGLWLLQTQLTDVLYGVTRSRSNISDAQ